MQNSCRYTNFRFYNDNIYLIKSFVVILSVENSDARAEAKKLTAQTLTRSVDCYLVKRAKKKS